MDIKRRLGLLCVALILVGSVSQAQMLKAYFPYYRSVAQANAVNYSQLTDVIYAFASLDASGNLSIMSPTVFNAVRTQCIANNVRLWVAVGGWGLSANFPAVAASPALRANFANSALALCTTYGLAGIDIDWEFPTASDRTNFTSFLSTTKTALTPGNYKLSIAVGAESFTYSCVSAGHTVGIEPAAIAYVDYVNVMTYDAPSCFTNHTSLDFMQRSLDGWNAFGVPYNKMIGGLAFYSRCAAEEMYSVISAADPSGYFNDADGINGGYCYDSKPTIQAKTNAAMCTKGIAGMMIWEVSQDRSDAYALLPVAKAAVDACGCSIANFSLGADRSICGFSSIALSPTPPAVTGAGISFTWKRNGLTLITSTSALSYTITTAGTYELSIANSSCSRSDQIAISTTLSAPDLGASSLQLCNPASISLSPTNLANFGPTTQWQAYKNGVPLAATTLVSDIRTAGIYAIGATVPGCGQTLSTVTVTSNVPTPVDICSNFAASVTLSITSPGLGAGPYYWFANSTGGSALSTGTSFTTPMLSSTTTYYVQDGAGVAGSVGANASFGSADWSGTIVNKKMAFVTSVSGIKLNSVDVYIHDWTAATNLQVRVETAGGTVIGTSSAYSYDNSGSGTPYRLTIDLSSIPALGSAGSYNMYFTGSSLGTIRLATSGFPITEATNSISFVSGNRYFTNLQFVAGSGCSRLPVIAKIGGCTVVPTPITFLDFSAKATEVNEILLQWQTTVDPNHSHFIVQKSLNGTEFEDIDVVTKVSWTANGSAVFSFADQKDGNATVYYRIKQIDRDGKFGYSKTLSINPKQSELLLAYPNPFVTNFTLTLAEKSTVLISTIGGQELDRLEAQDGVLNLGTNFLPGSYVVKVLNSSTSQTFTIVKMP